MLHELLLSLWGCSTSLEKIVESDSILLDKYFHPGERGLIKEIQQIANDCNFIRSFIKTNSITKSSSSSHVIINTNDEKDEFNVILKEGLYLQALCDGMDKALEPFRDEIADLEKCILHNAHTPATTILSRIEKYQHLFNILKYIIRQINSLKIHGCALLQCIHQQIHTGMPEVKLALEKMTQCVYAIFYKQLTSWLLYGQLEDVHKEFFIQKIKTNINNTQETTSGVSKKKLMIYGIVILLLTCYHHTLDYHWP